MNVMIVGCGRTGSLLATRLDDAAHNVIVVDWDPEAFARLPETFSGQTYRGNGVDEDVLRSAGIEGVDVFVAATSGDNRNIMSSQIAREVFGIQRIVTRIKDPERARIFGELGYKVDCRTTRGADTIIGILDSMRAEQAGAGAT